MDARFGLTQWLSSVFDADLPDYDWSRLDLAGTIPDEKRLVIRLAVGAALFAAALFVPMGGLLTALLLILSMVVTGYDYAIAAVLAIRAGKPFNHAIYITLALILALAAGDRVDAAAFMILYRVITILVGFITVHTVQSMKKALGEQPKVQTAWTAPEWIKWVAPLGLLAALIVFILQLWVFEAAPVIAVRCALSVLVIANPYSLVASAALTWLCAMNGAYRFRILFRGCASMRKLLNVKSVVLDDTARDETDLPKVVSVKSDRLKPDMLLRLAAYAESRSDSRTAKAIVAAFHEPINDSLIEKALDIPNYGVEAFIKGLHVFVGTKELMLLHSVTVPEEDLSDGYVVYVSVQGTYAGKLMLREVASQETHDAMEELRQLGVRSVTLFSPAQNDSVTMVARDLKAQLFCKLSPEEKDATLARMQKGMPRTESVMYIERDCESRPVRSPADINICLIRADNQERFDADCLIVEDDLNRVVDAVECAQWVNSMRKAHFLLAAAVKAVLLLMAIFGKSTMWFAAVLDGAAVLATLLLAIRAYGFDKQHFSFGDLLRPYCAK